MPYHHDISPCFEVLGRDRIAAWLGQTAPTLASLQQQGDKVAAPLLALPARTDDLEQIMTLAARMREQFCHVVIAGAGGSGLSGRALAALNLTARTPYLHFLETIDPDTIEAALARCELPETAFIVISKSGRTAETLGQFYALLEQLKSKVGASAAQHFTVITSTEADNPLRAAAIELGCRILDHAPDIGGRFSILTAVGLLPAALAGLDIAALRRGAQAVIKEMQAAASPEDCRPAIGAAVHLAGLEKKLTINVFLPYAERLSGLAAWWRQSWAESLGKNGKGSTPIRALGTTDQHSQLQLYLDGPKDKLFHLLLLNRAGTGQKIHAPASSSLAYLRGKTTGDIMAAEQKATLETLVKNGCPVRVFALDTLAEEQMGALLMHLTLEIIFTAALLGVNPFDQPAVEEGKRLARDYLLTGNV
jgi:glucose-6-phosphate isomerase